MKIHCQYSELVPVAGLKEHPKNSNKHPTDQIERLARILEYQGWRYPVKVSRRSGFVTSGHGRILAAKLNGWREVPVSFQDYEDETQEIADVTSDNAIASWAELDLSVVNNFTPDLGPDFDIDLLGIKDFELEPADKFHGDEDAVPEVPSEPKVKRGELWILGEHRLLIDDCTVRENVERLMGGEKADMVFTDPPYGIDLDTDYTKYGPGRQVHRKIEGDAGPFNPSHILGLAEEVFVFGANFFAWDLPRNDSWIVWDKRSSADNIGQLDGAFGSDVEICWSKQKHGMRICRVLKQTAVFAARTDDKQLAHPTQKPIGLAEWFLYRWGKDAKNIWDGYLGSGSTLIACEKTNRKCFGMEIDPFYGQVILERWAKFTGKDPIREDGVSFASLKSE